MKTVLVIGATGDVGQGIVQVAVDKGWQVIAVGRNQDKLAQLATRYPAHKLATVSGDISTEDGAESLWTSAQNCFTGIDAVVVSVNAPPLYKALMKSSPSQVFSQLESNVLSHFVAAKAFVPKLPAGGAFIGLGGGMADLVVPKMGTLSMAQAALRMMYRYLDSEFGEQSAKLKELILVAMINGASTRETADPSWITDIEVGTHVCAIIEDPERFPGAILKLRAKAQVGHPEKPKS